MKKTYLVLSLLASLSTLALANGANPPSIPRGVNGTCVLDEVDVFSPDAQFSKGPYANYCYNSEEKRSGVVATQQQLQELPEALKQELAKNQGVVPVANFWHEGRFWIALISLKGVEKAWVHVEHFPAVVPAAHSQIRFRMRADAPIRLIPQKEMQRGVVNTTRDFVFSAEAVMPYGTDVDFDLFNGMDDNFGLAHRFISTSTKYKVMVMERGHRVEQMVLQLTTPQKEALLRQAITISNQERDSQMYHTLWKSCYTEVLRTLDTSGIVKWNLIRWAYATTNPATERYPILARMALWNRGVSKVYWTKSEELRNEPDLNNDAEFVAEYIQSLR